MKKNKKLFSRNTISRNTVSSLFVLFPIIMILNIYCSIPSRIIIPQDSEYSLKLNKLCDISGDCTKLASVSGKALSEQDEGSIYINTSSCGEYNLPVKIFNSIPIKTISVTVAPMQYVVPSGDTIGIKLYTDGLLVVSVSDFTTIDGTVVAPAKNSGLQKGDRIIAANGTAINTAEELAEYVSAENPTVNLTVIRDYDTFDCSVTAKFAANGEKPKLGIWVRDSTAGIGTLTFYDPSNCAFAALGHAICDPDTGDIMKLRKGSILSCNILSVVKGERGTPGELVGSFGGSTLGTICDNNELGIYGTMENYSKTQFSEAIGVATRFQIKEGPAKILANIDGDGVKEYSAEIVKVSKSAKIDNKGLIIKVTDENLISKTGGIVQGMSGSPIIQNNLLIGAVTHVFVNDPTRGYGIFAENLLNSTNVIN